MRYVIGNVLEAAEQFIVHGCNAQGVMGAGVAAAVKNKFPHVYRSYRDYCEEETLKNNGVTSNLLGKGVVDIVHEDDLAEDKFILNLISQDFYSRDARMVNYSAVVVGLNEYVALIKNAEFEPVIAMPRIGAGLGGGDWNIIETLILDIEKMTGAEFVVYDLDEVPGTVYSE